MRRREQEDQRRAVEKLQRQRSISAIASSVEYPADRLCVAFEIRPEARFSDGSPITAENVVYTFKALRKQGHPTYRVLLSGITDVTAEAPLRVRFDFHPDAPRSADAGRKH
jgi:microcin C transport system substrate-binding protein